jgi:hypothetical protein
MTCIHRLIHLSLCLMFLECRYSILLLDFVQRLTHILKHHVSEAGTVSFKQETPNLFDPLHRAIVRYWVPISQAKRSQSSNRGRLTSSLSSINRQSYRPLT